MRKKIILILFLTTFLLSLFIIVGQASADAILFPWVIKNDTVSTIISVVNTAGARIDGYDSEAYLHFTYWYKNSTANEASEVCVNWSFNRHTSANDVVSFDASGLINEGKPLFNDPSPDKDNFYKLSPSGPRLAFLIVDNNTPFYVKSESNNDGTLYGEALIIDYSSGLIWGYTAYNPRFTGYAEQPTDQVFFNDGFDYQGEVIGMFEKGWTILLPPAEYTTKFFITPIGLTGQRWGNINTQVKFSFSDDSRSCGIFDNDETPIDFNKYANVTCTAILNLSDMITESALYHFNYTSGQGWANIKAYQATSGDNTTSEAVIGKLETTILTKTVSVDLTDSEGCAFCKEDCMNKCKKLDFHCQLHCVRKCNKFCSPNIKVDTWPGNFTWIRSGESLPPPLFNY